MMWWPLPRYSIWLLLIFSLARPVTTFILPGCNSDGNFDIVQNQQPFLTCTGLEAGHNIYWSITDPSSKDETRIAECKQCNQKCPPCSNPIEGYNVSRESNESTTLQFLNTSLVTDESTIKCSALWNHTNATCQLFVVPAYRITECSAGAVMVVEKKTSPIVCEGLLRTQNMYWTSTYENETVSTIAECEYCRPNTTTCPRCVIKDTDFNVTREGNSSTLVIQNNIIRKDGATLRCSKRDNATHSDCEVIVVYLEDANTSLHDNWAVTGNVKVSKVPDSDRNITCFWYNEMHHLASSAAGLTPYNDSTTGKGYLNVSCHLNTTLSPFVVGSNEIFVEILPYGRPFLTATVNVEKPGSLILNQSTCLLSVKEGSNVTCTCENNDDNQGYPSGRVLWTNNAGSAFLELTNIQHNHNGVVHVCQLLWGPHDEVFDTLNYSVTVNALHFSQEQATGLPLAAVAGSAVGFVFIVAVVIGIAVILKRRRSKRTATTERQDSGQTDDEFEEHINEFYQSADDPDLPRHSSTNSPAPLSSDNPSVDTQGAGTDGPQNDVYAQVNKEKKKKFDVSEEQPGTTHDVKRHAEGGKTQKHADKGENQGPSSEEQGAVYTECVSDSKIDNSVTNVYMNVDESPPRPTHQDTHAAKKDSGNEDLHDPDPNTYYNTGTTRHQGDYTNVQPELNEAAGMTKTAESADDYRHLQFSRPKQLEENPNYNHLKDL